MRRLRIPVGTVTQLTGIASVLAMLFATGVVPLSFATAARPHMKMDEVEITCGQELSADAEVPDKLAQLMNHVASNMETHATWVGASGPAGQREHEAMVKVARAYRDIAQAATRAAVAMKSMKDIPATPHDPARMDRPGQARWMRRKIELQLAFAGMITEHAKTSKKVLMQMEGVGDTKH